jgi:hypothetical protein
VAGGRPLVTGRPRPCQVVRLTAFKFFDFFKIIFWSFKEVWGWAWQFGRMGIQHPHFLKLAPILRSGKFSIPHGAWRFHFNFFWLKLEYTEISIFTIEILVS